MKTFRVTIKNLWYGYNAPSMYIEAAKPEEAEAEARTRSALGAFPKWGFTAQELKPHK